MNTSSKPLSSSFDDTNSCQGFDGLMEKSAVLQMNQDALTIASELDAERRIGPVRSPLHGVPFFVKDNIASKDKLQTTAGS